MSGADTGGGFRANFFKQNGRWSTAHCPYILCILPLLPFSCEYFFCEYFWWHNVISWSWTPQKSLIRPWNSGLEYDLHLLVYIIQRIKLEE
jgi:hypothetical protein